MRGVKLHSKKGVVWKVWSIHIPVPKVEQETGWVKTIVNESYRRTAVFKIKVTSTNGHTDGFYNSYDGRVSYLI